MSGLLDISGLRAGYSTGGDVLHDVALSVAEGEAICLLGANGAGKTTVLRAISGMTRRSGRIVFGGEDLSRLRPEQIAARGIAHVPDGRGTIADLTVEENLLIGGYTVAGHRERLRRLDEMMERFPRLRERRAQRAGLLSGGEQQMLAIGKALMQRPRLLLLDEPSFGLAPVMIDAIFTILTEIRDVGDTAILLVEQNAQLALKLSRRAYLLESGNIVMHGASDEIAGSDVVKKSYLGAD